MRPVTVDRARLLEALEANRAAHLATYQEAIVAYREQMIGWHQDRIAELRAGQKADRHADLPEPENHTADYDAAIEMLRWSVTDTMQMDDQSFTQLVLDQWAWTERWRRTTSSYSSH